MTNSLSSDLIDPRVFRDVLGHFPTGVAVVTAIGDSGKPIGMAVGSFTSVSLNPPLVAFLPDKSSSTFPKIRAASSFCVNVLSASQEQLCRAFAMRGEDKFQGVPWSPAPSGAPVLEGVVAWIDCTIADVHDAGDHYIVVGQVGALEIVTPTYPLIFFQGGYGAFAPRSLVMGAREGLSDQIHLADAARDELENLSRETGAQCRAIARAGDRQIFVAAAGPVASAESTSLVGVAMPFIPPIGALFVAWAGPDAVREWYDRSPVQLDDHRRAEVEAYLDVVRDRGWLLSHSRSQFGATEVIAAIADLGQTPLLERKFKDVAAEMGSYPDLDDITEKTVSRVSSVSAPVFGANGEVLLMLSLLDFPAGSSADSVLRAKDRLLQGAAALTRKLGGAPPSEYHIR